MRALNYHFYPTLLERESQTGEKEKALYAGEPNERDTETHTYQGHISTCILPYGGR